MLHQSIRFFTIFHLIAIHLIGEFSQVERYHTISMMVPRIMSEIHVSGHTVDDEISERTFLNLFQLLDGKKIYFEKADIEEFEKEKFNLDDYLMMGDLQFIDRVFDRYQAKLQESLILLNSLKDEYINLLDDDYYPVRFEDRRFAESTDELKKFWIREIKHYFFKTDEITPGKRAVEEIIESLKEEIQFEISKSEEDFFVLYVSSFTKAFDPHSEYLSKQLTESLVRAVSITNVGVGLSVTRNNRGEIMILSLTPGGAAEKDGRIKAGDIVIALSNSNGESVEINSLSDESIEELFKGKDGENLTIRVRTSNNEEKNYSITRQPIKDTSHGISYEIVSTPIDPKRIAVIKIPSFYFDYNAHLKGSQDAISSSIDLKKVLESDDLRKIDGIIIDLRNNLGGVITPALEMAGLFISSGPIVQISSKKSKQVLSDYDSSIVYDGPLAVLVNQNSASASELFAAAIQDYRRGIILGDTSTFGKGTAQNIIELENLLSQNEWKDLGAVKGTTTQFYRINGMSTQKSGVKPDVILPSVSKYFYYSENEFPFSLPITTVEPANYEKTSHVTEDDLKIINLNSSSRIKKSKYFINLNRALEDYESHKNKYGIPLNLEKQSLWKREFQLLSEFYVSIEYAISGVKGSQYLSDHPYNSEVLNIMSDYMKLWYERKEPTESTLTTNP